MGDITNTLRGGDESPTLRITSVTIAFLGLMYAYKYGTQNTVDQYITDAVHGQHGRRCLTCFVRDSLSDFRWLESRPENRFSGQIYTVKSTGVGQRLSCFRPSEVTYSAWRKLYSTSIKYQIFLNVNDLIHQCSFSFENTFINVFSYPAATWRE